MTIINWKYDLKSPAVPGEYPIDELGGDVWVDQEDIAEAEKLGGAPDVEVKEMPLSSSREMPLWVIREFRATGQ